MMVRQHGVHENGYFECLICGMKTLAAWAEFQYAGEWRRCALHGGQHMSLRVTYNRQACTITRDFVCFGSDGVPTCCFPLETHSTDLDLTEDNFVDVHLPLDFGESMDVDEVPQTVLDSQTTVDNSEPVGDLPPVPVGHFHDTRNDFTPEVAMFEEIFARQPIDDLLELLPDWAEHLDNVQD